jgi:TonB family protein
MKHGKLNIEMMRAIRVAVLLTVVFTSLSAMACSHGVRGLACDSVNREAVFEDPEQMTRFPVKPKADIIYYAPKAVRDSLNSTDKIFTVVEQMPQFPGGEAALKEYIDSHIQWPPMAGCAQGRVIVQFVVDKTGKVGEVKVVRSLEENLDEEAVRICKSLPDFIPGRQNGQAVSVWYTLPVSFKLKGVGE